MRRGQRTAWPRTSWAHPRSGPRAVLPASRTPPGTRPTLPPADNSICESSRAARRYDVAGQWIYRSGSSPLRAAVAGIRHFQLAKHGKYYPILLNRSLASLRAFVLAIRRDGFALAGRVACPPGGWLLWELGGWESGPTLFNGVQRRARVHPTMSVPEYTVCLYSKYKITLTGCSECSRCAHCVHIRVTSLGAPPLAVGQKPSPR